jgi:Ca2+-binding RTX toxin-like protein
VTTVHATDPDSDPVTYSIVNNGSADDGAKFDINPTTGALTFHNAPDFENPTDLGADNSYVVQVKASDGSLFDTQTITVNVTNVVSNGDATGHADTLFGTDGDDTIDGLNGNDTISGFGGSDTLNGGNGQDFTNNVDTIDGGPGNDIITGNDGGDILTGGTGSDTFVYKAAADSAPSTPDTITDFVHGQDKIDVSSIDANGNDPGKPAFNWGGAVAVANGVWYSDNGTITTVHVDTNGNAGNDEMTIILTGTNLHLNTTDFAL